MKSSYCTAEGPGSHLPAPESGGSQSPTTPAPWKVPYLRSCHIHVTLIHTERGRGGQHISKNKINEKLYKILWPGLNPGTSRIKNMEIPVIYSEKVILK